MKVKNFKEFINESVKPNSSHLSKMAKKDLNKNSTSEDLVQWVMDQYHEFGWEEGLTKKDVEELIYELKKMGYRKIGTVEEFEEDLEDNWGESLEQSVNEAEDVSPYLTEVQAALPQLEKLIKKRIGASIKLQAEYRGSGRENRIQIYSKDVKNELGNTLVKTMFSDIRLSFRGGLIRDGKIWFIPKVKYSHPIVIDNKKSNIKGNINGLNFIWDELLYVPKGVDHSIGKKGGTWIEGRIIF